MRRRWAKRLCSEQWRDGPAGVRAGGGRGQAAVPGEPDASRLVVAVRAMEQQVQVLAQVARRG